jgi:hypothetical protein
MTKLETEQWEAIESHGTTYEYFCAIIDAKTRRTIAEIATEGEEGEKYARRIAALPDLLSAAEEVLGLKCPKGVGYSHALEAKYCRVCGGKHGLCPYMKLKLAVAKAKGGNNA